MQKANLAFLVMILMFFLGLLTITPGLPVTIPTESPATISTEAVTAAPATASTEAPTTAPTAAPTEAPTAAPTEAPMPAADLTLMTILAKIAYLEEGTAGSSLKLAAVSGEILDWAEGSMNSQADHEIQITYFMDGLGDAALAELFKYNFGRVATTVQLLIGGDPGTLGSLESAGYTLGYAAYTQAKWDTFALAVQNVAALY